MSRRKAIEPGRIFGMEWDEIQARQQGANRFSVRYGLQVKERLTYAQAATELGACLMHDAACSELLEGYDE